MGKGWEVGVGSLQGKLLLPGREVKECVFQWERGFFFFQKKGGKITRWNKHERRGIFPLPPSASLISALMMMVIDIQHTALISRSKIMHLTPISKLAIPRLFFFPLSLFFAVPAKRESFCASVQSVCAAAGPYTMRGFYAHKPIWGPEMRSTTPSHHALIIN